MKVSVNVEGLSTVISPEGRIDTVTAPELEESLSKIPSTATSVTFDFSKVEYISSAGLRILLVAQKQMKKSGASMTISNISPTVRDVFDITGFSDILTIA